MSWSAHAWVGYEHGAWTVRVRSVDPRGDDVLAATRLTEAEARLAATVIDLCWMATPYGEDDEGAVTHYLLTAGTVHRLIGAAQGVGLPAAFRRTER